MRSWKRVVVATVIGTVSGVGSYVFWTEWEKAKPPIPAPSPSPSPPPIPSSIDPKKVPRLWGYTNVAHGCPVSPDTLLTAAHVLGERREGRWVHWRSSWADGYGNAGEVSPLHRSLSSDLIIATPSQGDKFVFFFPHSLRAPQKGETLYIVGYDWEGVMEQKVYQVTLIEAFGANLTYKGSTKHGSSGSCVFLADGTVVGVNVGEFPSLGVGVGVGVGEWVEGRGKDETPTPPD